MAYVIKNISGSPLPIDGVTMDIGEQLGGIAAPSKEMLAAKTAGKLQIKSDEETLEERQADVAAIKPFRVGDPDIDGTR